MPSGGGLDLEDVRVSHEEGCIELDFQLIDIVKPKRLLFESFGYDHEWNYFRLEADELEPSGVYEVEPGEEPYEKTHDREEVTQIYPGQYEDYNYLENSSYREQEDYEYERPKEMKHVTRWFRGSFVIFCKRSVYNRTPSTYDGRHNKMTTDEFRDYIQRSVDHFKEEDEKRPFFEKLLDKSNRRKRNSKHQDEDTDLWDD
jgi:serine/threonine-protein kinase